MDQNQKRGRFGEQPSPNDESQSTKPAAQTTFGKWLVTSHDASTSEKSPSSNISGQTLEDSQQNTAGDQATNPASTQRSVLDSVHRSDRYDARCPQSILYHYNFRPATQLLPSKTAATNFLTGGDFFCCFRLESVSTALCQTVMRTGTRDSDGVPLTRTLPVLHMVGNDVPHPLHWYPGVQPTRTDGTVVTSSSPSSARFDITATTTADLHWHIYLLGAYAELVANMSPAPGEVLNIGHFATMLTEGDNSKQVLGRFGAVIASNPNRRCGRWSVVDHSPVAVIVGDAAELSAHQYRPLSMVGGDEANAADHSELIGRLIDRVVMRGGDRTTATQLPRPMVTISTMPARS